MEFIEHDGEVEVKGVSEFDLHKTFNCGQCFRWEEGENGAFTGVAFGEAARLRQFDASVFITGSKADFERIWRDYFDLERDYEEIRQIVSIDGYMSEAAEFGKGIRILRQERWEALCSFIISQNNNIPRIKGIISALCRLHGDSVQFGSDELFTFPSAAKLAALEPCDLAPLRCGYRAEYIVGAARAVDSGEIDLDKLAAGSSDDARTALKRLHGVGDKVADCAMLYGLHMPDVFPVDVWMKREIAKQYGRSFDPRVFSPYAGIAQQYMFYYARHSKA